MTDYKQFNNSSHLEEFIYSSSALERSFLKGRLISCIENLSILIKDASILQRFIHKDFLGNPLVNGESVCLGKGPLYGPSAVVPVYMKRADPLHQADLHLVFTWQTGWFSAWLLIVLYM